MIPTENKERPLSPLFKSLDKKLFSSEKQSREQIKNENVNKSLKLSQISKF
jgi:hypothetical protein